ncbi:restriction endonuclease subunit S [Flavobacterium psychraquaticum]|uniref:restriction endonuclease subunit S n=1 Tax=Flavobacterium psychraquaticum TaxID=3103958 RepID=UPI002ACDF9E5|nr:restriction endonuclease subunit S [Flavobacterium sp. LB-N7T]
MSQNKNILPQGWTAKPINQVFEFIGTSSFSRNDINYEIDDNSIYYIHYGDIHATYKNAVLDFNTETRIPVLKEHIKPSTNFLKEGDLIIADASEDYEGVGEALEVYNIKDKKVLAGLHTFALRDKNNETAHGYRAYLFKNPEVKKRLKTIATGSKVYGISKGNLEKFKITLPPLPEQQKIANILATWDKAVKKTELIIHFLNKRNSGLMKMLFHSNNKTWKKTELKNIGKIVTGTTPPTNVRDNYGNDFLFVSPVDMGTEKYITKSNNKLSLKGHSISRRLPANSILYTCIGSTIGKIAIATEELSTNQQINSIICNDDYEYEFVYYLLIFNKNRILEYATNQAVPMINKSVFEEIVVAVPSWSEQIRISKILMKADNELKYYTLLLSELQKQKQGLMQQLLTGKIRVKN